MDDEQQTDAGLVDAALAAIEGLDDRPVGEHQAAYEEAHRELRAALEV